MHLTDRVAAPSQPQPRRRWPRWPTPHILRPDHARAVADLSAADLLAVRAMLAAGADPATALAQSLAPALEPVRAALRAGLSLPELAASPSNEPLDPAADALVRALATAQVVGASAGAGMDGVLHGVGAAARLQSMITLHSTQAVMSAKFLVGLPLVAATGLAILDGNVRSFLISPIGLVAVAVAVGLIATAAVWIRRLIKAVTLAGGTVDPLWARPGAKPRAVMVVTIAVGIVATMTSGPLVGLSAAVVLRLIGAPLHRRFAAGDGERAGGGPDHTPDRPEEFGGLISRTETLPTVQAIELLAVALSGGVGLLEAVRVTATLAPPEVRPVLRHIAAGLRAGLQPAEAFPDQLTEVAGLIDISYRWGAPIAQSLRMLAADLRDRAAIAAEEAAERLAVRLVFPTTLLLVPAFGLLVVTPMMASILSDVRVGL